MNTILLAGAGGYIGLRIAKVLKERGYRVAALDIRDDIPRELYDDFLQVDFTESTSIEKSIDFIKKNKCTGLICAVGLVDYKVNYELLYKINVETVKNILEIYRSTSHNFELHGVFLGSVASRGFSRTNDVINEDIDLYEKGISSYCDVKREVENHIQEYTKRFNLNTIVLQPGSLVGKELEGRKTTNIGLIEKIIKGFPLLSGGASYTSVNRVADAIVESLTSGESASTYLLGGENLSMKDFSVLVWQRYALLLENAKVKNNAILPQLLSKILGTLGIVLSSQQVLLGNAFHCIDYSKASKKLKYQHSKDDLIKEIDSILEDIFA